MSTRSRKLSRAEIAAAFDDTEVGPILTTAELAEVLGDPVSTIYEWVAQGRFDGAFRKRGENTSGSGATAPSISSSTDRSGNEQERRTHQGW